MVPTPTYMSLGRSLYSSQAAIVTGETEAQGLCAQDGEEGRAGPPHMVRDRDVTGAFQGTQPREVFLEEEAGAGPWGGARIGAQGGARLESLFSPITALGGGLGAHPTCVLVQEFPRPSQLGRSWGLWAAVVEETRTLASSLHGGRRLCPSCPGPPCLPRALQVPTAPLRICAAPSSGAMSPASSVPSP